MEERQSRLSNMDWKRFRPYLCVRLIPQNSMFSNFCHVLKSFLFDTQLFGDFFGKGIFVYKNIHSLVSDECFGSIPDTIVFA